MTNIDNLNNYINNKSIQKKLSKIPQSMLDKLTQNLEINKNDNLSLSDKLRSKINKSKISRLPKNTRNDLNQKQEMKENKENVESTKNQNKTKKNRLKKLNKKYGMITDDDYYNSLEYVKNNDNNNTNDTLSHHKNIIDLYNYQHSNDSEMNLDINESELVDN